MNIFWHKSRLRSTLLLALVALLTILLASCADGGSSGSSARTGSITLRLRQGELGQRQGNLAARDANDEDDPYLNRLLVKFYSDAGDHQPSALLLERDETILPGQETVVLQDIPAPQDYYIAVDIYYSDSETPYTTANFIATVLPGQTTTATPIQPGKELSELKLNPGQEVSIMKGKTQQYEAIALYTDGSQEDVTAEATWSTSNPSIATISDEGLATGIATGECMVSAYWGGVTTDQAKLTVTPPELAALRLEPNQEVSIPVGTTQQYKVMACYTDGSEKEITTGATWSTDNPEIATISDAGLAKGVALGSCNVSAAWEGKTAQVKLTVTSAIFTALRLNPNQEVSIPAGTTQQYKAIACYSDGSEKEVTTEATWSTDDTEVATISNAGLAKGVAAGECSISAVWEGTTAPQVKLTVSTATLTTLRLNPNQEVSIPAGTTQQYKVMACYSDGSEKEITTGVAWSTDDTEVATISNTGLAKGIAAGECNISAVWEGTTAPQVKLTVTTATLTSLRLNPNQEMSIPAGTTQQYKAIACYSDGSAKEIATGVTWSTSAPTIATISDAGLATGIATGDCNISAEWGGETAQVKLTVTAATLTALRLNPNQEVSIPAGTTQQYKAIACYSDGSEKEIATDVTWSTSDSTIATISDAGLATGVGTGNCTVSAAWGGKTSPQVTLAVTAATLTSLRLDPSQEVSIPAGTTQQYKAIACYSDGSEKEVATDVTWSTSDSEVATVSSAGLATGVATGECTVSASWGGKTASSATLTVTAATLTSLRLDPNHDITLPVSTYQQFKLFACYSDGSEKAVQTNILNWAANPVGIVLISGEGLVYGEIEGECNISATWGGQTSPEVKVTVTDDVPISLRMEPNQEKSIAIGATQQYKVIACYSDGSEKETSGGLGLWSTSDWEIATVSGDGLVTGVAPGECYVSYNATAWKLETQVKLTVSGE